MGESFYNLTGPLDALPAGRQMRAANFGGFTNLVRHMGGDPRSILERHSLDSRAMHDPDFFIDCKDLVDVLEHCSASLDEPLFGLHLAQMQSPDVYGCVTAQCRAASTFREAVRCHIDYIPVVHSPATKMELVEGEETAELRWSVRSDIGLNDQANYQAVSLNLKLLRLIGGPNFRPSYVNLAVDARRNDSPKIEDMLGCRFHGGAPSNAIAFPVRYLDQRVESANRTLFRLLGGYLDRLMDAARTSIKERVEDYVRGSLPSGGCSIEHCAKRLGTSVRTLQSQLSGYGVKFSDILEEQRIELAKTYLQEGRLSLDETAALLGYSEQSSFGRAFKRWTGSTPHRFRAALGLPPIN
jgi:AraC-like DNA-binding protein